MKRLVLLVGAVAAAVSLAGCGGGGGGDATDTTSAGPAAKEATVVVKDIAFKPSKVRVAVGGKVTWKFDDGTTPHNVVANDESFKSDVETTGTFEQSFEEPGSYKYTCTIHPAMKGTVTVVA
jgi:plastocyanin